MHIFIDESGSFVSTNMHPNSWNCVIAYCCPEKSSTKLKKALLELKISSGKKFSNEVKLRDTNEEQYFKFLKSINKLDGIIFAVATNGYHNNIDVVREHQRAQKEGILKHISKMKFESGKEGLNKLANDVKVLSPQLYLQLQCQVTLLHEVLKYGVVYFVQRIPSTLGNFRWRIDQKNSEKPLFEKTFQTLAPGLLQSISFRDPMIGLIGEDYSHFDKFNYKEGEEPTYLRNDYGINIETKNSTNIGRVIHEDIKFEDSEKNYGVQVADLLASGFRRCLRNNFNDNFTAQKLLGGLTVQHMENSESLTLITLEKKAHYANDELSSIIKSISVNAEPMLKHRRYYV